MFKFKFILTALLIMFAANLSANAGTIGYADFQKVISDYSFARNAYKDSDNKLLELQQYAIDKDKQFKAIESPIQRKTFEEQVQREYKAKEDKIFNLKIHTREKRKRCCQNSLASDFFAWRKNQKEKQNVSNHNQTVARSRCTLRSPHKKMEP